MIDLIAVNRVRWEGEYVFFSFYQNKNVALKSGVEAKIM